MAKLLNFSLLLVPGIVMALAAEAAPISNPNAPVKGTFVRVLDAEPPNLHPLKGTGEAYASVVHGYIFDTLLTRNPDTYEFMPWLAEKWEVAKDGKSVSFTLRSGAKFHNGQPITIEDVKFSFDVLPDPKLSSPILKDYYANIDRAEITGPNTIKFHIKKKYFKNLEVLATMTVLPKSVYSKDDKSLNKNMVGSGPYMVEKYDKGRSLTLKRVPDWWGFSVPEIKGQYNFEKIIFRIVRDENTQLEMFKKGEIDFLGLSPEQFEKKTSGPMFGKTVFKEEVQDKGSRSTPFIGFNFRIPMFQDRDTRRALAHLFNTKEMIQKFHYNRMLPATGPWYQQNPAADPDVKPVEFSLEKASALLKKAGWEDKDKNGVLEKTIDGKTTELKFTTMVAAEQWQKFLTIFKEDLKKAGIVMDIKQQEWNSFTKALDEGNFEAVGLSWTGTVEYDPFQIWHSTSAVKGGSNFINYKRPDVDKLIDQAREELNTTKRNNLLRKAYRTIAEDSPYIFLWNSKATLYGHSGRVDMLKPGFNYGIGHETWWAK